MTGKERIGAILQRKPVDRIGLVEHFWDQDGQAFKLDLTDEIMKGCLLTHKGEIVNERLKELKQS